MPPGDGLEQAASEVYLDVVVVVGAVVVVVAAIVVWLGQAASQATCVFGPQLPSMNTPSTF